MEAIFAMARARSRVILSDSLPDLKNLVVFAANHGSTVPGRPRDPRAAPFAGPANRTNRLPRFVKALVEARVVSLAPGIRGKLAKLNRFYQKHTLVVS